MIARQILNPTYRSEMLYRVVDNMAYGSQTIVTDFTPVVIEGPERGHDPYAGPADQILRDAAAFVQWIERPVWRDRALVAIAAASSASKQFARGLEVARMIPQPEVRTDALVRLAEGQARFADREARIADEDEREAVNSAKRAERLAADAEHETRPEAHKELLAERDRLLAERDRLLADRPARVENARVTRNRATSTYRDAAVAVASIPLDDPRAILAGVLIDNLISVGRFEDARSTIVLYPDTARRIVALGAIAESQGRRGAAESARDWINRDVPAEYRAELLRRVNNGILSAIEQNRSRDLNRVQQRERTGTRGGAPRLGGARLSAFPATGSDGWEERRVALLHAADAGVEAVDVEPERRTSGSPSRASARHTRGRAGRFPRVSGVGAGPGDPLDGVEAARVLEVAGDAEHLAEVGRPDEQEVNVGDGGDLGDRGEGGRVSIWMPTKVSALALAAYSAIGVRPNRPSRLPPFIPRSPRGQNLAQRTACSASSGERTMLTITPPAPASSGRMIAA